MKKMCNEKTQVDPCVLERIIIFFVIVCWLHCCVFSIYFFYFTVVAIVSAMCGSYIARCFAWACFTRCDDAIMAMNIRLKKGKNEIERFSVVEPHWTFNWNPNWCYLKNGEKLIRFGLEIFWSSVIFWWRWWWWNDINVLSRPMLESNQLSKSLRSLFLTETKSEHQKNK